MRRYREMPEKVIAFCGLDCAACPAFHAAQRLSMTEREKVAAQWSKEFKADIKGVDIDCVGCTVKEGAHVAYCAMCQMRACGAGRGLSTCADCPEFACKKLEEFMQMVPAARPNLEALRTR
jgi:Protein of unknown function (DUF3795)